MMTDAELVAYHRKAVEDCNALLGTLSDIWAECNGALRDPANRDWPPEVLGLLTRIKGQCNDAVRKAMTPPTQERR